MVGPLWEAENNKEGKGTNVSLLDVKTYSKSVSKNKQHSVHAKRSKEQNRNLRDRTLCI